MDRDSLVRLLSASPIRILMNDGNSYVIDQPSEAIVDDISCYALYRKDGGKYATMVLPLVTMSGVEPLVQ
ncbi:MAG: hypothetical protein MI725_18120 [Pirellulales bacterium]|nr:hypothetical protein [Pirellulales bacterium]